jgi:hypothetical protein
MDNGALAARAAAALGCSLGGVTLAHANALAGAVVAAAVAPPRLGGTPRGGLAALAADVAPYPRLHFVLPGLAPVTHPAAAAFEGLTAREVVAAALSPGASLASAHPDGARGDGATTLAAALLWRGGGGDGITPSAVADAAASAATRAVDWAPAAAAVYFTPAALPARAPFAALPCCALALVNSEAFASVLLASLGARFDAAFGCRAHVAAYCGEGMEESELSEARADLAALADEYAAAAADTLPQRGSDEGDSEPEGAPSEA